MADLPLVSPLDRALFLAAQPYFDGLDAGVIATLATYAEERFARPGEWLHHEGEPIREISFLAEGEVSLMRGTRRLREISAPGGVGLASSLAELSWSPGIVATLPTVYLCLSVKEFAQILEDRFPLVLQIANTLSQQKQEDVLVGHRSDLREEPLDLIERIAAARRNPLFAKTNLIALVEIIRSSKEVRLVTGATLWTADTTPKNLALVLDGSLCGGAEGQSFDVGAGDLVGLDQLLATDSRQASLQAATASRILLIPKASYFDALEDHFDAAQCLLRHLARRFIESWD